MKRFIAPAIMFFPVLMLPLWVYFGAAERQTMSQNIANATIAARAAQYGPAARTRLRPFFDAARVAYPPARIVMLALKQEKLIELYAAGTNQDLRFICSCPILAASGTAGPKLREGDRQVPEGVYPVESLNPNSKFHLALRLGYPNQFDREQARHDGRDNLGGDIMIHGGAASVGCLAVGDEAVEDLFVLTADTGISNVTVIVSPVDFRKTADFVLSDKDAPAWTAALYQTLKSNLSELPLDSALRTPDSALK
jgi:L,D-transpeptidase catalytic domain